MQSEEHDVGGDVDLRDAAGAGDHGLADLRLAGQPSRDDLLP